MYKCQAVCDPATCDLRISEIVTPLYYPETRREEFFFPRGLIKNLGPQERNCAKIPNACEGGVRSPSLTALEYLNNRAAKSAAANELFLVPERRNVVAGTELQEVG